jgi:hypothetical protein
MAFSKYPESLDDSGTLPVTIDNVTPVRAEIVNRLRSSVISTQTELGTSPSGTFGTVKARLDALDVILNDLSSSIGMSGGNNGSLVGRINILESEVDALQADISVLQTNFGNISATLTSHINNTNNPHNTTAALVGAPNLIGTSTDEAIVRFDSTSGQMQDSANGPYVADTGELRLINNINLTGRNFGNTTWVPLIGLNSSNELTLGGLGNTDVILNANNNTAANISNSRASLNGYLELNSSLGTTSFPTVGSIRLKGGVNNNGIFFNSSTTSNVQLIGHDAANNIVIGSTTINSMGSLFPSVPTTKSMFFRFGLTTYVTMSESQLQLRMPLLKLTDSTSGAGTDFTISGSDAFATSNADGGDITITPGAEDGSGTEGRIIFTDAASNEVAAINSEGLSLTELSSDPTATANKGFLYTKESDSVTDLFYADDSGYVTQIIRDRGVTSFLNVLDFGAERNVSGGGDAIQDAINEMLNNIDKYTAILVPPGEYKLTRPLRVFPPGGVGLVKVVIWSTGGFGVDQGGFGATLFTLEGPNPEELPVMIIQGGRGCEFVGINFVNSGNPKPKENLTSEPIAAGLAFPEISDWVTPGVRTNGRSPCCAVVIDPFTDGYPGNDIDNTYPGFEDFYGGPAYPSPLGSSKSKFVNCCFIGGYVGVASSPPGDINGIDVIQNNENNNYINCSWIYNTFHYASGQSQERGNSIYSASMFGSFCAITTEIVGPGGNPGNCPYINMANIGGTRFVFDLNGFQKATLQNIYVESSAALGRLGQGVSSAAGGYTIDGLTATLINSRGASKKYADVPTHLITTGICRLKNVQIESISGNNFLFKTTILFGRCIFDDLLLSRSSDSNYHTYFGINTPNLARTNYCSLPSATFGLNYLDDIIPNIEIDDFSGDPSVPLFFLEDGYDEGVIFLTNTSGLEVGDMIALSSNTPNSVTVQDTSNTSLNTSLNCPFAYITNVEVDSQILIQQISYGFEENTNYKYDRHRLINLELDNPSSLVLQIFSLEAFSQLEKTNGNFPGDGEGVENWISLDSSNFQFSQSSASLQPLYQENVPIFNHTPGLLFDGIDDYLISSFVFNGTHNGTGTSFYLLFHHEEDGYGTIISSLGDDPNNIGIDVSTTTDGYLNVNIGNGTGTYLVESSNQVLQHNRVYEVTIRHGTGQSPEWDIRLNGESIDSGSYTGSPSISSSSFLMNIGRNANDSDYFGSEIQAIYATNNYNISNFEGIEDRILNRVGADKINPINYPDGILYLRADRETYEDDAGTNEAENADNLAHWKSLLDDFEALQSVDADRPQFLSTGYTNSLPTIEFDGTETLSIINNEDFDVADNSFMCFFVGNENNTLSFRCFMGTGNNNTSEGFRCFIDDSNQLVLFFGIDGIGGYVPSTTTISSGIDYVLGWGIDANSNEVIYVINDTIERKAVTVQTINNIGDFIIGGSSGTSAYNIDGQFRGVYFFNRKDKSAIDDSDITSIVKNLKALGTIG